MLFVKFLNETKDREAEIPTKKIYTQPQPKLCTNSEKDEPMYNRIRSWH
jgi:hypothetical protein